MSSRTDLPPTEEVDDVDERTAASPGAWIRRGVLIVGSIIVFVAHFRPWEGGFLEEWSLAQFWAVAGPVAFVQNYAEWSLSRPLHLVPTAIGLAISPGSTLGVFLVLALVAVGLFLFTFWAVRPISRSFWATGAVAFFIALHPLWAGGFLQRFLPAQTAALALVISAGMIVRWFLRRRVRWIIWAAVVMAMGLAVYPGSAAAGPLLVLVVALISRTSWARRAIAVGVAIGVSALMTLYSLLITRLIAQGGASYDASNLAGNIGPREFVNIVGTALLDHGLTIVGGVLAVAVLGAILALTGAIPHSAGWLMAATALVSPACAIVFFGNVVWLSDIARISYATTLGLFAALIIWPLTTTGRRVRLEAVLAVVIAVLSVFGAVRGVQTWQPYIALQHQLLAEIQPVVDEAEGDEIVVVVDHSGTYGTEYTLPQYYLNSASYLTNHDDTFVWLCYDEGDPALPGAPLCAAEDTGENLQLKHSFSLPGGEVEVFIGNPKADG